MTTNQFQLCVGDYFKEHHLAREYAKKATGLIGWINNHGKVRVLIDEAQEKVSMDRLKHIVVLAYLIANITHWTTHSTSFAQLLKVKPALRLAVLTSQTKLIEAEVGAATGVRARELEEDAEKWCEVIDDTMFWEVVEQIVGDLKPICFATNIGQRDGTHPDTILLSLVGIFIHFANHPLPDVAKAMTKRIEKRWKDCDQPFFLLALILNPFEQLSRFGEKAGISWFRWKDMLLEVCQHLASIF